MRTIKSLLVMGAMVLGMMGQVRASEVTVLYTGDVIQTDLGYHVYELTCGGESVYCEFEDGHGDAWVSLGAMAGPLGAGQDIYGRVDAGSYTLLEDSYPDLSSYTLTRAYISIDVVSNPPGPNVIYHVQVWIMGE